MTANEGRRWRWVLGLLLPALAACTDTINHDEEPGAPASNRVEVAVELSASEVPGGSAAVGAATGSFEFDPDARTLSGTVLVSGLDATAVTLDRGYAGEVGQRLTALEQGASGEWSIPADTVLAQADVDLLAAGALFVIVRTAAAPEGALRGQLLTGDVDVVLTTLTAAQSVPPASSPATAAGAVTFDPGTGSLVVHVNTVEQDVLAGHLREAPAGTSGPVIAELLVDPDAPGHWFIESLALSDERSRALATGALYLELEMSDGARLRGQLAPAGVEVVLTRLVAGEVVPPTASTGSGIAATTIRAADRVLTIHVNHVGLDGASSVTIARAPAGQNGPVVFDLTADPNDVAHWSVVEQSLSAETYGALLGGELYVVSTSGAYPDGALRGQIEPMRLRPLPGGLLVVGVMPEDGAVLADAPTSILLTFSGGIDADSVSLDDFRLEASGGDGSFAEGNEVNVPITAAVTAAATVRLDLAAEAITDDVYRLTAGDLADLAGEVLDGDADGVPGGEFGATFTVRAGSVGFTFTRIQDEVFTPSCALSGCHAGGSPAAGMNLSAGRAYASTVGVASTESMLNRIEPGDPEASYLVHKIEGTGFGGRMPLGQPPLPGATIQGIRDWIRDGAPDN